MPLRRIAPALALLLLATALPAGAAMVDSEACRRDVVAVDAAYADSMRALEGVADGRRELCPAWRAHREVAKRASAVYARCYLGTDRRVGTARMNGVMADFDDAIARGCAGVRP
jgi:hypothetical protein